MYGTYLHGFSIHVYLGTQVVVVVVVASPMCATRAHSQHVDGRYERLTAADLCHR